MTDKHEGRQSFAKAGRGSRGGQAKWQVKGGSGGGQSSEQQPESGPPAKVMYAPKASATNTAILKKQQQIAEERKMGSPSMNFLRKIYNLISHKYEQLDEIKRVEAKLKDRYNGDLKLALSQAENGNWTGLTEEQLKQVKSKEQVEESIQEYMTMFNMYK